MCHGCGLKRANPRRLCADCAGVDRARVEHHVRDLLKPLVPPWSAADNVVLAKACGDKATRPDLAWLAPDRLVVAEIDEDSHIGKKSSCEVARTDRLRWGTNCKGPLVLVRFNPDVCDTSDDDLTTRVQALAKVIQDAINRPLESLDPILPNVKFMYYHSKAQHLVDAQMEHATPL